MYIGVTMPIPEAHWTLAERFAVASMDSRRSKIASRQQTNTDKILLDIMYGAIAELAVADWLRSRDIECSYPDFAVYAAKDKSFSPDLICAFGALHIKTYSDPRWASWVFQYGRYRDCDPLVKDPHPHHYLVLTRVDPKTRVVGIEYLVHQPDVISLFADPIIPRLRSHKRVLYPDKLKEVTTETGALLAVL